MFFLELFVVVWHSIVRLSLLLGQSCVLLTIIPLILQLIKIIGLIKIDQIYHFGN